MQKYGPCSMRSWPDVSHATVEMRAIGAGSDPRSERVQGAANFAAHFFNFSNRVGNRE